MSSVTVWTTGARATIKVSPTTYLADVREQACEKLRLDPESYLLKHNNKQVDLTVQWRMASLPAGARLDLVVRSKTPSVVKVSLRIDDVPGQLTYTFPSTFTIWQVLRQFESGDAGAGKNLRITTKCYTEHTSVQNSPRDWYVNPDVIVGGRPLSTIEELQKTLFQLGFNSGTALIRVKFTKTQIPYTEALKKIEQHFKEGLKKADTEAETSTGLASESKPGQSEPAPAPAPATQEAKAPDTAPQPTPSPVQQPKSQEPPNTSQPEPESVGLETLSSAPPAGSLVPTDVFLPPSGSTPAAALVTVDEADYTLTTEQATQYQAHLQREGQNKRLLSDDEIAAKERAASAKLAAVKSVQIRVRFPDQTAASWTFGPNDTGETLYRAIRGVMNHPDAKFHVTLQGLQGGIKETNTSLVKGYKLAGRALVHLAWDDSVSPAIKKAPFLNGATAQRAQKVVVQDIPAVEDKEDEGPLNTVRKLVSNATNAVSGGTKKPKWFTMGKK